MDIEKVTNNPSTKWDWHAALLLAALVMTISVRLEITRWAKQLGYVESITLMGILLGLALGVTVFGKWPKLGFVAGYSLFYLPIALANMIDEEVGGYARLASLVGRLQVSLGHVVSSEPVTDPVLFVCLMGILLWFTGILCSYWLVTSRSIGRTLFLPTIFILAIQYFDGQVATRLWNLAVYFFLCMALIGRLNLLRAHDGWAAEGVIAGTQPEADLNRYMLVFSAVLIFSAWLVPYPKDLQAMYTQGLKKAGDSVGYLERRFQDLFAALTPSVLVSRNDPFPNAFVMGTMAASGNQKVMTAELVDGVDPMYWPGKVYDRFSKGKWVGQSGIGKIMNPADDLSDQPYAGNAIEVRINWQAQGTSMLVMPHNAVWASRVATRYDDGSPTGQSLYWVSQVALQPGEQYTAKFSGQAITQRLLREASTNYPDTMAAQLTEQQDAIAPDVKALAEEITAGQITPFDKAAAITRYLRATFEYSETTTEVPENVDPVVWFLFNEKKGFCDQFATAEVVLLRASSVPARLVLGYTGGEKIGGRRVEFQRHNAHAWPEVFFPDVGWVIFEPTPSIEEVIYPTGEVTLPTTQATVPLGEFADRERNAGIDQEQNGTDNTEQLPSLQISWQIAALSVFALLVILYYAGNKAKVNAAIGIVPARVIARIEMAGIEIPPWLNTFMGWLYSSGAAKSFVVINVCLRMLGSNHDAGLTPRQKCERLAYILPDAAKNIERYAYLHERALFFGKKESIPLVLLWAIFKNTILRSGKHWLYGT